MRKIFFVRGLWPKRKKLLLYTTLFIFSVSVIGLYSFINSRYIRGVEPVYADDYQLKNRIKAGVNSEEFIKFIFRQGFFLAQIDDGHGMFSPKDVVEAAVFNLTEINVKDPKTYLKSQLGFIKGFDLGTLEETSPKLNMEYDEQLETSNTVLDPEEDIEVKTGGEEILTPWPEDNPLVGIYNTHNAETYLPTDGVKKVEGKNGGVEKVAETLENSLKNKYGIPVVRSKEIHDYPRWALSYSNSKNTAKKMLAENKSIQILLDIHRDAGVKEKNIIDIDGKKAAQILIIIGSDKRLDHPNWKKNKEFADSMCSMMDELYPGLCRGVRMQDGRYNQHLHPNSLVLEMGNVNNSLEEAEYSAELMSHIIHGLLNKIKENRL
ncbi:MAG: stage II sporulation protein P [Clostridia bacterium]|nr:stage II sporulation protein P [Clostridia bacterium]